MSKQILVTGGLGFIGSHLCLRLLKEGHYITCLDDLSTGQVKNLHDLEQYPNFRYINWDIINPIEIEGTVDEIYNLACPASPIQYQKNPIHTNLTSVVGMDVYAVDKCTSVGQSCVYSVSYEGSHSTYTYQPVNIGGSYKWNGTLNYSRNLDKKHYWTVQSNASTILYHSVDYSMFSGDTESRLNKVSTYTLEENAYIQYNKETLNIRATGDVKWRRSKGRMLDFSTLCAVDYQYGLSARYTIPKIKTTLSADCNVYSRRGYGSTELNTNDFVMNASVFQSLLKGKLIARLESFDLFHQLSNTQYEVNAQGRVETWYRSLPHYIMLHLVYHWNRNPKK